MEDALKMSVGRLFHSLGAAIGSVLKDLHVGIFSNIPLSYDLRLYLPLLLFTAIRLEIYDGASPWIALKVISSILKTIRYLTGSQCSMLSKGDIICSLERQVEQPHSEPSGAGMLVDHKTDYYNSPSD